MGHNNNLPIIGWREWVSLPQLDIPHIKAKIDTGARTSALHAFSVEPFHDKGAPHVHFLIHPWQKDNDTVIETTAPISDQRWVSDSGGHREQRYVIVTDVVVGDACYPIEITLTNRDTMQFRMLLGRTALAGHYLVHSAGSYLIGEKPPILK